MVEEEWRYRTGQCTVPPDALEITDNLFTAEVRDGGRGCGTLYIDTVQILYMYMYVCECVYMYIVYVFSTCTCIYDVCVHFTKIHFSCTHCSHTHMHTHMHAYHTHMHAHIYTTHTCIHTQCLKFYRSKWHSVNYKFSRFSSGLGKLIRYCVTRTVSYT